jgi:hypothetical protein
MNTDSYTFFGNLQDMGHCRTSPMDFLYPITFSDFVSTKYITALSLHGCLMDAAEIEREARHVKDQGLTIVICRTSCK